MTARQKNIRTDIRIDIRIGRQTKTDGDKEEGGRDSGRQINRERGNYREGGWQVRGIKEINGWER